VLVAVQDSGPGLEATMLERVFESFYTTKPTGLGLGLSICRSIIEAHGGRLWASTNQRRGATFQFTLPGDAMCMNEHSSLADQFFGTPSSEDGDAERVGGVDVAQLLHMNSARLE
jgi:hypothetical protein